MSGSGGPEKSESVDTFKKEVAGPIASFIAMIFMFMPEIVSASIHRGDINLPVGHGTDSHVDTGGGGGGGPH